MPKGLIASRRPLAGTRTSGRCWSAYWAAPWLDSSCSPLPPITRASLSARRATRTPSAAPRAAPSGAAGHTIPRIAYHLLQDPASVYDERGAHDVSEHARQAIERDVMRRRQQLGNTVVLHPVGAT
ncbi:MAG: hypothetical protein K0R44_1736 [Thermomicrobiales bacterium]|nr:hypothetical protein [Thermomicrobiales bacterium]